ncbi:hypothetical protein TJA_15130 [Thermus sp. LT1-2-5]|uniref:hypothetical protein n=1 Tax=Thermus sp. LT1-2-5 TaxID=3026935 RepID=UPI0030E8F2D4
MKRKTARFWKALALGGTLVLAACNGGGPSGTQVQVALVNGLNEPINATAAAYRVGNGSFQPLSQSGPGTYTFTVPAGQDRYTVVFRCPYFGTLSGTVLALSYELTLAEATAFKARCPSAYAGPEANLNQTDDNTSSQDFNGGSAAAYSATSGAPFLDEGGDNVVNDIDNSFRVPVGPNREVAIFGEVSGTYYFGRGFFTITPTTTSIPQISVSPVSATFGTANPAQANLLGKEVNVSLGSGNTFPKPSADPNDLYQVLTFSGNSAALRRIPASSLPATVNLSAPSLTFSPSVSPPVPGDLPTFQGLSASGFSAGISLRGYLLELTWPTSSRWQHFVSQGALSGSTYALPDPTGVAGLSALKPTSGDLVGWQALALGTDKPLNQLLAADPIPQGFGFDLIDRRLALELEAASDANSYTQP